MNLTQKVCYVIDRTSISFIEERKIGYLLVMLWGNNIHINQTIRNAIVEKIYKKQSLINYLDNSIESGDVDVNIVSEGNVIEFFTMMLTLGFGCSKQIRNQLNRGLHGEARYLFNLGCKAYYEIKKQITSNYISPKTARRKLISKFSVYHELERNRQLTNPIYNYGPRMSDSNEIWRNDISKYVISIPIGGQNKKY